MEGLKTKEEIFNKHLEPEWGSSFPHTFKSMMDAMAEYSLQMAIAFTEWIGESNWEKDPTEEDMWYYPTGDDNEPDEQKTTGELYKFFLNFIQHSNT